MKGCFLSSATLVLCTKLIPTFPLLPVMNNNWSNEGQHPIPHTPESYFLAPLQAWSAHLWLSFTLGRVGTMVVNGSYHYQYIWNINNYQFLRHREGGKSYIIERTTNGILILFQLWLFGLGHLIPISIASLSLGQKFNTFAFWTSHCL